MSADSGVHIPGLSRKLFLGPALGKKPSPSRLPLSLALPWEEPWWLSWAELRWLRLWDTLPRASS